MQATLGSGRGSMPADRRFVVFISRAPDLVPGDTNDRVDVFVHDRLTGDTTRMSVASDDSQLLEHSNDPSISADGRYVVFDSPAQHLVPGDTNGVVDAFVHDLRTGNTARVSIATTGQQANGPSRNSVISADGHFVAFIASTTNLVPQATNGYDDVFVRSIH